MTDFTLLALLVAGFISLVLAGEEDCYCSQCTRVLAPGVQPVLLVRQPRRHRATSANNETSVG